MNIKNRLFLGFVLLSAVGLTQAMEQEEIWFEVGKPIFHKNITMDQQGNARTTLSGPAQNGYYTKATLSNEGPLIGSIIIETDDPFYSEDQTEETDMELFEYLQKKYLEQNLPEKRYA